jgi:hypothetical protein
MSKLETKVAKLLKENNISYEREKTYKDLKLGQFRFDFFLPEQNAIIEVNGQQHYYEVWGGRAGLLKQQENDRRKISYALANKIKMYTIPYWEIDNLHTAEDLFKDSFKVMDKWFNDKIWKEYQKTISSKK